MMRPGYHVIRKKQKHKKSSSRQKPGDILKGEKQMVRLYDSGVYLVNGTEIVPEAEAARVEQMTGKSAAPAEAKKGTIAYSIMNVNFLISEISQPLSVHFLHGSDVQKMA